MLKKWEQMGLAPWGPSPTPRHMEWYRRGKTAFLHFTVNTFTDREWGDGTESPAQFAPGDLDCRQWARVLKEAGFTAAILTAKHHDGFCLWPSAYTEHSVKHSPLGRDVVREFTDACREFGIKPGVYISPWDRHDPTWGTEEYNDRFAGQLTELMTQYGPIWECWWDGAGSTRARYDWKRWADIVRTHQSQCVLFGCLGAAEYVDVRWVGNEEGRAGEDCWATIEPGIIAEEICEELNTGDPEGSRFIPAETNTSIRPGWFYHAGQDSQVKPVEELVEYWFRSAGRNTAILLNLPPDPRGLIHGTDAAVVKAWNRRMEEIFDENLAASGTVTPGAENLFSEDEEQIWYPGVLKPEFRVEFAKPVAFDCLKLQEVIELGHRIRGFRVEALTGAGWEILLEGKCVGYCRSCRFPEVTATALRVTVTESAAPPVLRFFGLYRGAAPGKKPEAPTAGERQIRTLTRRGSILEIELGGIYPYNAVELRNAGDLNWQVHVFNGTRYETVAETRESLCRFDTQTGSYRLMLTAHRDFPEDMQVSVRMV